MPTVECVLEAKARVGESAIWDDAEKALFWTDIEGGHIHRFDPAIGANVTFDMGERTGCMAIRQGGGAVVGTESGIYTYDFESRTKTRIADPEAHRPENRFNDSCTDRQGRWWLGSCGMMQPPRNESAFYRLDADHSVTRWREEFYTTNGLAFSPDGRTMYFSDSNPMVRKIWVCDYDPQTGTPGEPRLFFDTNGVPGRPDGGTVDNDGCYWMAGVSGWQMLRLTPAGEIDMIVDMPVEKPSKPAFGGPDNDILFVTSIGIMPTPGREQPLAGGLFAITGLPCGGLPSVRFAG
ncbi:SMP-30/gluconolactonase/LRE family protein [Acuticoccus sp. MNP-M23]|uniref:SMP-30/gluconolactonase/LRE family protein n=1 Tax=Acuticoccus sp. MNP-M23 TaxID=3072793 RepID=UPI0028168F74|nr:SMP-30/gluconolactonase/LRE family protein [Acuticoccus sp. MNP-M23]WMS42055.1 SMP-30/gluconolactonase/LRE family protein [Acuticoccus sp. MNP-M23]